MRTTNWLLAMSVVTVVGLGSAACHDSTNPAAPPTAARVVLSQTTLALKPGDKVTLTAQPQSSDGTVLARAISWASDNVAIATVASTSATTAEVTGVALGTATITATADGQSASTTVTVAPSVVQISSSGGTIVSADSNFILEIPAGALDTPTTIAVTKADIAAAARLAAARLAASAAGGPSAARNVPAPAAAAEPVYIPGTGYSVEPAGLTLKKPASITIKYNQSTLPSGFDPQQLRIRQRQRTQTDWQDCDHTGVQNNAVQGSSQVLSIFALYGRPTEAPVAASVNVTPATLDVETGDVVQLSAVALDAAGTVLSIPVTWAVDDPAIATVDASGLLTAIASGTTSVTATAGGKQGSAGLKVNHKIGSVHITALPTELIEGSSAQLGADVRDPGGNAIGNPAVTWTSLTPAIATVDQTGKVTGVSAGDATIVAQSRAKADTATVTVSPNVTSITITGTSQQPLSAGKTLQLTATAYNSTGQPISAKIKWTSSSAAIATVSSTGLVTGVASGTATITAASANASASADVRVTGSGSGGEGGDTTTTGNNLSWPVVFAEGIGLTGLPVATDAGLRPTSTENVTVNAHPFFNSGNVANCALGTAMYYCQKSANVWQAEWLDGSSGPRRNAEVKWGDNLTHHTFGTHAQIRVEVALNDLDAGMLRGYNMTVISGSGSSEMQGTDGSVGSFVPTLYTRAARLIIEKLDDTDTTRAPIITLVDKGVWEAVDGPGNFAAEVNVGGKVVYGYNFKVQDLDTSIFGSSHKFGWWRFTFVIGGNGAPPGNLILQRIAAAAEGETEAPLYTPVISAGGMRSSLSIYINKDGGGGEH